MNATAVIACGALAGLVREIAARRGWAVEVRALPATLHNRPDRIAPAARQLAVGLQSAGYAVALAYADCGSYGALDAVCAELGLRRLPGLHCYDVLGGPDRVRAMLEAQPGTYLLTDFLVASFRRTVLAGLGLDRYPELWPDYFGQYRRLVWLAQARDPALEAAARDIAAQFGLPLTIIDTGTGRLEAELERLVTPGARTTDAASEAASAASACAGGVTVPGTASSPEGTERSPLVTGRAPGTRSAPGTGSPPGAGGAPGTESALGGGGAPGTGGAQGRVGPAEAGGGESGRP